MDLPEFRIDMNFNNMQQLDDAMTSIIRNEKSIDDKHVNFNKLVDVETIQHFYIETTQMKVNSWTHHQPFETSCSRKCISTRIFEVVKNTKLRDYLQIMYETREDLDGIKKTLEDLGVEVIQVDDCWTDKLSLNPYKNFAEFLETNKNDALTKAFTYSTQRLIHYYG